MRGTCAAVFLVASSLSLVAQAPASAPQTAVPSVFRSGIDLVRLDVRVSDASGHPVKDLTSADVEVMEGGQQRPILLFQHIEQPEGPYADVARRTVTAEVSTNQGAPRGHVYVLVFDQLHITPGNEQRARKAAERFLRTRIRPGDRISLYALPGPGPQIEFTSDAVRAAAQLVAVRGSRGDAEMGATGSVRVSDAYQIVRGNPEVLQRYVDRSVDSPGTVDAPATATKQSPRAAPLTTDDIKDLRNSLMEDARAVVGHADADARRFLRELATVVRTLRDVDGRKSVIIFSEGFEIDNVRREVEEAAAAAAQSYSVIHALDLNARLTQARQEVPDDSSAGAAVLSRLESLGSLASETDGTLFNDAGSDVDRVLDRISEASQDYYLVGFAPSEAGMRNRDDYRRVSVRVTRPGVRVQTRSGYSVGQSVPAGERRRAIDAALRAPFSQQGLRVEYTTYVLRGSADRQRVILSLNADLPVATQDSKTADVVFAARDVRTGRVAESGTDTMRLPEAARPGAATGTGTFRIQFELPPGVYVMRAVVREPGGLIGSADRRFTVRALTGPSVTAADLILSSADTAGLGVRTIVASGSVITGVTEVYGRTPAQLASLVIDAELVPVGQAAALTRGRASLDEVKTTPSGSSRGARVDIPLQDVTPGDYIVRATVKNGRETVAELLRDVTIASGQVVLQPAATAAPATTKPVTAEGFDPRAVLEGDLGRRFVSRLRERTRGGPMAQAAELAFQLKWESIEAALPPAASGWVEGQALKALGRFAARDYVTASALWKECVDREPGDALGAFLLGWAYAATGDDRAAIGAWRAAVAADQTLVSAYLSLIDAYLRLNELDLARQVAQAGAKALPKSAELRDRLDRLEKR
ncbi:MAG: VWA domain-containing protein [Acidobacteriota bacterium]